MNVLLWAVVVVVVFALALFFAYTGFMVAATARRMQDAKALRPGFKITAYVWFVPGVIGDFIGNIYLGLKDFREGPRWLRGELMFSSRIQRHVNNGPADKHFGEAVSWGRSLDAGLPGHIKHLPVDDDQLLGDTHL